ncbi:MAG: hypothetical protein R6X02_05465 [Enhygromyxa sp.]
MSTRRLPPHRGYALSVLTLLAGFTISACTAFFVPDEDDDGVQRCNNSEDCDSIDDNRYIPQCIYGEGQPENSSKVCAADLAPIECGDMTYPGPHPLSEAIAEAVAAKAAYGQCSEENRGKRGCQPNAGVCNEGLEINNATGACDVPNPTIPALYPPSVGGVDIAGQDAKDQFCRWYFCDETFVCARAGSRERCQPCSGTNPDDYGRGACGEIYIQGERSPLYTDLDDGANCNGRQPTDEALFGSAP